MFQAVYQYCENENVLILKFILIIAKSSVFPRGDRWLLHFTIGDLL